MKKKVSKKTKPIQKVEQASDDVKLTNLIKENQRLRDEILTLKANEKFIGIECLVNGQVWIPSPDSRSGRPEDREKGILLKGYGEIATVPAHWIVSMISNKSADLIHGNIRINNEMAKQINPSLNFVDVDIPDSIKGVFLTKKEVLTELKNGDQAFYEFLKKYEYDPFILAKISHFVLEERDNLKGTDKEKEKNPKYLSLSSIIQYLDDHSAPNISEDEKEESTKVIRKI